VSHTHTDAKEQGLRSRAAFKLTQINKKFGFLERCQHGILDLCAAPGGWTQIAARTASRTIPIIAVDIQPMRALHGHANVTTLVGDVTTEACRAAIQRAVNNSNHHNHKQNNTPNKIELVLHDGAPNVGAEYGRDAYEQNELALHALHCATQHLIPGGTFVTKVYRSRDYAALLWLLQQLFHSVQAVKPAASRAQSAEIFVVCTDYRAPAVLDPRLLDPKYVFSHVQGETTGGEIGGASNNNTSNVSIFHKNWDKPRRKRGGYDTEHLDATLRHVEAVHHFVAVSSLQAAIQMLSTSTGLAFTCGECADANGKNDVEDEDPNEETCHCSFLLHHPLTTPEIKESVSDLQVLNKSDFKAILNWRTKMQDALQARRHEQEDDASKNEEGGSSEASDMDSDQEEEIIQSEIEQMRQRRAKEKKKTKKKERAAAAKRRRHAALGMDLNAIDVPDHDKVFSLATITNKGELEAAAEVNLDQMTDEQIFGGDSDDDVVIGKQEEKSDGLDETERMRRRERELDDGYNSYLENTNNGLAKSGTKMAKRSKKIQRRQVEDEAIEDQEMAAVGPEHVDFNAQAYAEMLKGPDDDDSEDDTSLEDEDDGYGAEPMTPEEHAIEQRAKRRKIDDSNPLIHKFAEEATSIKTARWFSNPLFSLMAKAASPADTNDLDSYSSDDSSSVANNKKNSGLSAEEILASMPKTDKQKRHEKRLKAKERDVRRKARQAKHLGDAEGKTFELVPSNADDVSDGEKGDKNDLSHLSESQQKKVLEARELIKAGMGSIRDERNSTGIELVPFERRPLPVMDDRNYNSENEDYDSDDYAQTLALGTMMVRRSKEKALVDASYNRYAWNDPSDLPEWFVDDETKHYRPQLPIPPALIAKMKEKMMVLSAKPIKKVAEARARKNKRARDKLASAKKQAEAVANSTEMSEAMKLRAISKALRGKDTKKPGKKYVVAKKGITGKGAKGVKVVDKRMKSDTRALQRIEKRKKNGGKIKKKRR
jgi:AdoMet-dependent rRNA methyltransferase SPB1